MTLNTGAVQAAIDACASMGGGKVIFTKGDYVLSTVFLKSNVDIVVEKDARILGSLNFYDYAPPKPNFLNILKIVSVFSKLTLALHPITIKLMV